MKPFNTPPAHFPIAPIHAANAIQLEVYTDTRNVIQIWLPEGYGRKPHRCLVLSHTEDRRFFLEGDRLITTYTQSGSFAIRGEIIPIEDGVAMSLAITNLAETALPPSPANVCVQFAAAPSFADTVLERYFYLSKGKIVFFRPPYDDGGNDVARLYATAVHPGIPEHLTHNPAPDVPIIGLQSHDRRWVVGHHWKRSRYVWGNCHPSMSCLHADPFFNEIPPGETATDTGVLYIMEGTPEACMERFSNEFPDMMAELDAV